MRIGLALAWLLLAAAPTLAQVPPSADEVAHYDGLFAASVRNDAARITRLAASPATGNELSGTDCSLVATGPASGVEFRTVI